MAEKELVLLRKRREALNRAITALEELQRLLSRSERNEGEKTPAILLPFPQVTRQQVRQRTKR